MISYNILITNILFYIAIAASVFYVTHSKGGTTCFVHSGRPGHDEDGIAFKTFGVEPYGLQDLVLYLVYETATGAHSYTSNFNHTTSQSMKTSLNI